jgi:GH18 family chitinase
MLAIGGWNEGSSRFSPMVANPDRRKELIKNAIKFLRQNHFDGLDLDWEYPSFRDGGKSRDRDNYAQLVQVRSHDRTNEKAVNHQFPPILRLLSGNHIPSHSMIIVIQHIHFRGVLHNSKIK